MKRWGFLALFAVGAALLYALQQGRAEAPFTTRPILYLVADAEQEAERIPLRMTRVNDQEEMKIGAEIVKEMNLRAPDLADADAVRIATELNEVGQRLVAHVQRKNIYYHFYLQNDPYFVNAFALPGGNIVVGRGILELLESEDELAELLGHEIGHVDNRHAIERLQYEEASKKVGLDGLYRLGEPFVQIFEAGYSKQQELDADQAGLNLAVAAGYSPAGALNLMRRFVQLEGERARHADSPIEEIADLPWDALTEYFRTHPPANERLEALQTQINDSGYDASRPTRPLGIRAIFLTDAAESLDHAGRFHESITKFNDALALDGSYARAWRGLTRAEWRSGDAGQTVRAENEVAKLRAMTADDWHLAALALSVARPQGDTKALTELIDAAYPANQPVTDPRAQLAAKVNLIGLRKFRGDSTADVDFRALFDNYSGPKDGALAYDEMAWWEYRAGKLDAARADLGSANQLLPDTETTNIERIWVFSDAGLQADAQQICTGHFVRNPAQSAEEDVACDVVLWRTDHRDEASAEFRNAATQDPVWMNAKWVANNYGSSAAGVVKQLQTIELARRAKEREERRKAEQAAEGSK